MMPDSQGQPVVFREYPRQGCRGTAHTDVLVAVPEDDWLHQAFAPIPERVARKIQYNLC